MSIRVTGLEQLQNRLRGIQARAEELQGERVVNFEDLFPDAFVAAHSKYENLSDLFTASGFKIESKDDFAAIPDAEWEAFITTHTDFESWEAMQHAAAAEYYRSRLFG